MQRLKVSPRETVKQKNNKFDGIIRAALKVPGQERLGAWMSAFTPACSAAVANNFHG
jgi:hypothetical protein